MNTNKPKKSSVPNGRKIIDLRKKQSSVSIEEKVPSLRTDHVVNKSTLQNNKAKNRKPNKLLKTASIVLFVGMLCIGVYILYLLFLPKIANDKSKVISNSETVQNKDVDKIFIPSVGIEAEIKSGDESVLDQGVAWHRFPTRGNPENGGNFIVTGHSFVWSIDPRKVTEQSVFYTLNDAKSGDEVIVHWEGKKYTYTIIEKKEVRPDQTEIEQVGPDDIMTIYTCTTGGSSDGRVVLTAKLKSD